MTDLDSIDPAFGNWLAGFVDGEGCFGIRLLANHCFQCRFTIRLRADDRPILVEIQERLGGIGSIRTGAGNGFERKAHADWRVDGKAECAFLVRVFERFPLRAKKLRDFQIWRRAVSAWCTHIPGDEWANLAALRAQLRDVRRYHEGSLEAVVEAPEGAQLKIG